MLSEGPAVSHFATSEDQLERIAHRVLIADDDATLREIVEGVLVGAGYHVAAAANGQSALAFAREGAMSLALLDVEMPDGNGLETCQALRRMPGWSETPIIMVTAHNSEVIAQAAAMAGANGYFVKPFVPQALLRCVAAWTGRVG